MICETGTARMDMVYDFIGDMIKDGSKGKVKKYI